MSETQVTLTPAQNALQLLLEQDRNWATRPEVESTRGGFNVWCGYEVYRIYPDGDIFRLYLNGGERVIL